MALRVFNARYEIKQHVARGGMAEVFLARDLLHDRPVALKVLFPEFAADQDRKSTRLNSSHSQISYAVFCLKKKRSRHLARTLSLRTKQSSPNVFEIAPTETMTSIILIKLIRISIGTVRNPHRFEIHVIVI